MAGSSSRRETGSNGVTRDKYHVARARPMAHAGAKRKTQDRSPAFLESAHEAQKARDRLNRHGQWKSAEVAGTGENCEPGVAGRKRQTLLPAYGRFRTDVSALMIAQKPFVMSVA